MASATAEARDRVPSIDTAQEGGADLLALKEQIRQRAHEIWLERGDGGGSDVADWLQAESEILNR